MIIKTPVLCKRTSCLVCVHYDRESHGCNILPMVWEIHGRDYWKRCKAFDLAADYCDDAHKSQVMKVKGESFFSRSEKPKLDKKDDIRKKAEADLPEQKNEKPKNQSLVKRFINSAYDIHGIKFEQFGLVEFDKQTRVSAFLDEEHKVLALVIPSIRGGRPNSVYKNDCRFAKNKRWTNFKKAVDAAKDYLCSMKQTDYTKWIVIPTIAYEKEITCAETYYRSYGSHMNDIQLIEMDDKDGVLFRVHRKL